MSSDLPNREEKGAAGSRALCKLSSIFSPSSMVGSRAGRGGRAARLPTQPGHDALSPAAGPAAPDRGFPAAAARPVPGHPAPLVPPYR